MNRRTVILTLGSGLLAAPFASHAQAGKVWRMAIWRAAPAHRMVLHRLRYDRRSKSSDTSMARASGMWAGGLKPRRIGCLDWQPRWWV
jgi:hypothetical protein